MSSQAAMIGPLRVKYIINKSYSNNHHNHLSRPLIAWNIISTCLKAEHCTIIKESNECEFGHFGAHVNQYRASKKKLNKFLRLKRKMTMQSTLTNIAKLKIILKHTYLKIK